MMSEEGVSVAMTPQRKSEIPKYALKFNVKFHVYSASNRDPFSIFCLYVTVATAWVSTLPWLLRGSIPYCYMVNGGGAVAQYNFSKNVTSSRGVES